MRPAIARRPYVVPAATGFLFGALALVTILAIQHARHGWPFSPHREPPPRSRPAEQRPDSMQGMPGMNKGPPARAPVEVEAEKLGGWGVTVERARRERIGEPLRAVAVVTPDEARISHVHTRVAGWIERLYVNTTGQSVRRGEPLADIFSQQLLSSQNEYLVALESGSDALREGARQRLITLGFTESEIRALERRRSASRNVTVFSPRDGVVLHRGVAVGTAVDPSTEIVTVADLSRVWVLAEIPESYVGAVPVGTVATLSFGPWGPAPFEARVDFVYPTVDARTRTLPLRFVIENEHGALRPGIYGEATFRVAPREALTVSRDAVVDSGVEQHVFVLESEGRFVPRTVTTGASTKDRIEIRQGLVAGEPVVASGVFLIDSESRLRASGQGGMPGMSHGHGGPTERGGARAAPPRGHAGHEGMP